MIVQKIFFNSFSVIFRIKWNSTSFFFLELAKSKYLFFIKSVIKPKKFFLYTKRNKRTTTLNGSVVQAINGMRTDQRTIHQGLCQALQDLIELGRSQVEQTFAVQGILREMTQQLSRDRAPSPGNGGRPETAAEASDSANRPWEVSPSAPEGSRRGYAYVPPPARNNGSPNNTNNNRASNGLAEGQETRNPQTDDIFQTPLRQTESNREPG